MERGANPHPAGAPGDAPYEEIEHTADWSFRVRGRDLAGLFANAARALSSLEPALGTGSASITREAEVEGIDRESLLVNWLNELLHLEHSQQERYDQFDILEITDTRLRARLRGRPASGARSRIKAVTFHNLQVTQTPGGWEATLVLDV
jgi:SHS2 domain-containing protein